MRKEELFYERFADQFDSRMNMYDTRKRVQIVFDRLLGSEELSGKRLLDAGCGTGWFSAEAARRGAAVTSMDVGPALLEQVRNKCETTRIIGDIQDIPSENESFDIVVSSEVIEHVADPSTAVSELRRVLVPNGILALTTPNRVWKFAVVIANALNARPYQGLENWMGWFQLRKTLVGLDMEIEEMFGFHAFPFLHPSLYPLIDLLDKSGDYLGTLMVNMAIRARRK